MYLLASVPPCRALRGDAALRAAGGHRSSSRKEDEMSNTRQRAQWAEHLKDEAVELRAQQASAGSTHSPVEGPLPHSADVLEAAVHAERERCCAIASRWTSEVEVHRAFAEWTEWETRAAMEMARAILREISAGQRGESPP
jgi:hypothetical protein